MCHSLEVNTSLQTSHTYVFVCVDMYILSRSHQTIVLSHPPCPALQAELGMNIDQVLTLAPTEAEKCVQFPIADDNIALEPEETLMFELNLTEVITGVFLGPINMTTIIIQDNESMLVL